MLVGGVDVRRVKEIGCQKGIFDFLFVRSSYVYICMCFISNVGEDTFDRDDVRRSQQVDVYML